MLNQVCVLTVKVQNIKEGVHFYTNLLDFTVLKQYGENIISLNNNGLPLILEKAEKSDTPSSSTLLFGIQSTNIQEDFRRLQEKGVKIISDEPIPCPPGYYFVVEDNSGNQIEIVEYVNHSLEV
ncbi:VOC family protein [Ornithinibacillus contaminans]|uniref:VOC family protein n=1 Tax=Ornithinibacillus contaminans TaxID=694055 RepID=UPI00064E0D24|nr:VOC family protein [Ornithinibacillus contaminans]